MAAFELTRRNFKVNRRLILWQEIKLFKAVTLTSYKPLDRFRLPCDRLEQSWNSAPCEFDCRRIIPANYTR